MRKIIIFINNLIYKFKCITRAIFYIGSSDALPPPLTRDEEDDLINGRRSYICWNYWSY